MNRLQDLVVFYNVLLPSLKEMVLMQINVFYVEEIVRLVNKLVLQPVLRVKKTISFINLT